MNPKKIFVFIFCFALSFNFFAQNDSIYTKPQAILPGKKVTIAPEKDTLWVLNQALFKKTVIAGQRVKIYKKEVKLLENEIDTLKELNHQRQILIDTLKSDKNFYKDNWKICESDLKLLNDMNEKQSQYTKIAIIVGSATTVTAFIIGFILGFK